MMLARLLTLILIFNLLIPANAAMISVDDVQNAAIKRELKKISKKFANWSAPTSDSLNADPSVAIASRVATVTGTVITESIAFGVGTTTARVATITGASVTQSLTSEYTNAGESAIKNLDAYEQVVCHVSVLDPGMLYHLTEKKKVYIQTHPEKIEILFNSVTKKKDGMVHFEYGAGAEKMAATLDKGFFSFVLSDTKTGELKKTITRADTKDFPKECWVGKYSEAIKYAEKINIEAFLAATVDKKAMNEFISLQFKQANLGLETKKLCEKSYQDAAKGITSITTDAQKVEIAKKMKNNKCILLAEVDFNNRAPASEAQVVKTWENLETSCKLAGGGFKDAVAGQITTTREPGNESKYCLGVIMCDKRVKSIDRKLTIRKDDPMVVYCKKQGDSCPGITDCINAPNEDNFSSGQVDIKILYQ